ncbi:MAG: hypothetical protein U1D66_07205, partial [Erythrobacter sp.]|nr:hypothetical protein [Erythrobacter sp.]
MTGAKPLQVHYILSQLPEEEHTMWQLRHFLTMEREDFELFLRDEMLKSENLQVRRAASSFLQGDIKVQSGILSTLNSHMGI